MKKAIIITLIFGLCTTTAALSLAWREIMNRENNIFDYESTQIITLLTEHIDAAYNVSINFQSFFHASDFIDADEFRIFSEDTLENNSFIDIVAYCPKVSDSELDNFKEQKRYWGIMNYEVFKLEKQQTRIPVNNKDFYYPITFCEPYTPENVFFIGCDIYSQENLLDTLRRTTLSGDPEYYFGPRELFRNSNNFLIATCIYEGKQWPQTNSERYSNANGMLAIIVNSNQLLEIQSIPDNISVSLTSADIPNSVAPVVDIKSSAEPGILGTINLRLKYDSSVPSQEFTTTITKKINIAELNLWLMAVAFAISLALTLSVFFILKNRYELANELGLRIEAQTELIQHKEHLEEIVKERTKEISDQNLALENEITIRENAEKELKSTTSQLIQTEKLATIGQIAAGVAHEVNTPLGAIGSTNSTMQKVFEEHLINIYQDINTIQSKDLIMHLIDRIYASNNDLSSREIRKYKKQIVNKLENDNIANAEQIAIFLTNTSIVENYDEFLPLFKDEKCYQVITFLQRIATMINGCRIIDTAVNQSSRVVLALKDYARSEKLQEMKITDIRETINTALILWRNKIKHGIDMNINMQQVPLINCHSHELCQVWTNLIQNAIQAMNESGKLSISLKHIDNNIVVKISDNGPGIPEEIQDKIFDPLFTTKAKGEGTGLGLDISKRIIARHNGTITVKSSPEGTTFIITLPINSESKA